MDIEQGIVFRPSQVAGCHQETPTEREPPMLTSTCCRVGEATMAKRLHRGVAVGAEPALPVELTNIMPAEWHLFIVGRQETGHLDVQGSTAAGQSPITSHLLCKSASGTSPACSSTVHRSCTSRPSKRNLQYAYLN
ncbi:hypothetical protein M514_08761 [Trichuris suis]|uniref:Uncharacterized protein n=1 Tax=Trichuris suis TaxID=68888 RepID=A0A085N7F6_9BILA|nr:hypothetical protein M514_08761 [Trichuris suis]